jgi:hypothetical protein
LTPASETILLFGLSETETTLIKRLISSFEIEPVGLTISTVRQFITDFPEKKICLIVYRLDTNRPRQDRTIRLIRDFIGPLVPFLLLTPKISFKEIKKLLASGADDYMELPLNENRFSISFLILLELGQAMAHPHQKENVPEKKPSINSGETWLRTLTSFQKELNYFTPRSLLQQQRPVKIFDKWKQIRRLGLGGFGVVWLVEEIGTGRLAVAKTPHSPHMNIRVLRSAAILKRLVHHPNIVHLIEIIKDNGKFILIQEYVKGATLQQQLEKGITALDKEHYFLQLLSVITYAHKHKILHRDIKPENIMIAESGRLKLLDFGIARDLSWQPPGGSSEGTVNFMPPEQFAGQSCLASDVWAIGVILYIFTTNAVPYMQQNDQYPQNIETSVASRAPRKINPDIDIDLERIIMRCLQKDLNVRYKDSGELQNDLVTTFPLFGRGTILPA